MENKMIYAPFTPEQVENLNKFQQRAAFHPFTCGGNSPFCEKDLATSEGDYCANRGVLIATEDGWVCGCKNYTQNWAHAFMAEPVVSESNLIPAENTGDCRAKFLDWMKEGIKEHKDLMPESLFNALLEQFINGEKSV